MTATRLAVPRGSRRGPAWLALGTGTLLGVLGAVSAAPRFRDVPENHWARAPIERIVQRGIMTPQGDRFEPDRPVTRAELAMVLVRLVDAVEKAGPKPFDRSPARHDVPAAQRAALEKLPPKHAATRALRRLVLGGYLSPPDGAGQWLPAAQNLDRPAPAREVAAAVSGVLFRIEEKKVAVERPEALKEGARPETRGKE